MATWGFLPEHELPVRQEKEVGGVRLAVAELPQLQRARGWCSCTGNVVNQLKEG